MSQLGNLSIKDVPVALHEIGQTAVICVISFLR